MQQATDESDRERKKFLIVDDHPMVRDSLHDLLQSIDPTFTTEHALDMKQMQSMLRTNHDYSHLIVDLGLPDANGLEVLSAARQCSADLPIVVFTGRLEQELILRALNMGVVGYIPKTLYMDLIVNAFRMVLAGQIYIPRQAVGDTRQQRYGTMTTMRLPTSDPRQLGLTDRQIDVLDLILQGLPNKLICRQLDLAEGTVKVHVSAVLRALGVRNRTQAVIAAGVMGLRVHERRAS